LNLVNKGNNAKLIHSLCIAGGNQFCFDAFDSQIAHVRPTCLYTRCIIHEAEQQPRETYAPILINERRRTSALRSRVPSESAPRASARQNPEKEATPFCTPKSISAANKRPSVRETALIYCVPSLNERPIPRGITIVLWFLVRTLIHSTLLAIGEETNSSGELLGEYLKND
jgi:hypothetical protein